MKSLRAPFPYFGSKRHAAHLVWQALGDVASYCEPFCGSAAVLLARPGGPGRIETINDLSGHVANFWRSVRQAPEEVARHLDYPVIETDLHARHRWLVARHPEMKASLDADPDWCDPKAAGWWAWGASAWLGSGWCTEKPSAKTPNIGDAGQCAHAVPPAQLPHLSTAGTGSHGRQAHIEEWVSDLAERMRRVRVTCGDFRRVLSPAALCDGMVGGRVGIFYDPPYGEGAEVYGAEDSKSVAVEAAQRAAADALEHPSWRIVFAGYEGQHEDVFAGWRCVAWNPEAGKWGSGGYGRKNGNPQRERLWLSPACLPVDGERGKQASLFVAG